MAYPALISLKQTINRLITINSYGASLVSSTREILQFAYNETTSLQKVLERFNHSSSSESLVAMDVQIRDCAYQLEDIVESYESNQLYSDEGSSLRQQITSSAARMKKLEAEYITESSKALVPEEDGVEEDACSVDSGVEMVGYSSEFTFLRHYLLGCVRPDDMCYFSYLGEAGSCRTYVAKTIYEDLQQTFDCCAWVEIGKNYEMKEVLIHILAQVDILEAGTRDYELLEDEKISGCLRSMLKSRRYIIVLDDVPDLQILNYLDEAFPKQSNGSLVLFTTNLREIITQFTCPVRVCEAPVDYLQRCSWFMFRDVCFREDESICLEMEEAGKRIASNCRGLRIQISKTLLFLFKRERTIEAWSKIAADKENPIFMVGDEISELCEIKTEMQSYNWDMEKKQENLIVSMIPQFLSCTLDISVMKRMIHPERFFNRMQIISLLGMAGIGKSTYAKRLFIDKLTEDTFDHRVWLTLGPKYQAKNILVDILAQIYPSIDIMLIKGDEKLAKDLCVRLLDKRCLIVLDDLWSKDPLHHLKILFPDIKGTTLVTSQLVKEAKFAGCDIDYEMRLLNKEESWRLLRGKVLGEGYCSPELESMGRKISKRCEGLPLLILAVADQLLKAEISIKSWENIALQERNPLFMSALEGISKALLPIYKSLAQHLKTCFMYFGVFRNDCDISPLMLYNLWIAEGFLEPNPPGNVEDFAVKCLSELADRSLVMNQRRVCMDSQIKACRLHPIFRHLSNSEAVKTNFYHVMDSYDDCSIERINNQKRLCIRNSILLGFRDVYNSMETLKDPRYLICTSLTHQYPVPLYFGTGFLRILEALAIRFYEFPVEVLKSFHLKYLALTCNEMLPISIAKLLKLQSIVMRQHTRIKSSKNSPHLPLEIWCLKKLKHLQMMGGCLPNPRCGGDGLPELLTLLDVSAQSCTKQVLKRIPNLKRLGIRIELEHDDKGNSFRSLNRISRLRKLVSLKCVVVNPQFRFEAVAPPAPASMFPSHLKRLSLSGLGYPWDYMSIIGRLVNLEELKLKCYAFQGPRWDVDYSSKFGKLKFLSIEDTDLVQWEIKSPMFMQLKYLRIKHCYKLHDLPTYLPFTVRNIEIVDSNPLTLIWAEKMRQPLMLIDVEYHHSWIDHSNEEDSQYLSKITMSLPFARHDS